MSEPVIIVGGGVVGAAAAYSLAMAGCAVTLLEMRRVGWAASGRNAGAIRAHGRHQTEFALATLSLDRWAAFAHDSAIDFHFDRCGDLVVGFTEEEEDRLERATDAYNRMGLQVELLRGSAVQKRVPGVSPEVRAAAYAPDDAAAYPLLAVRALSEAARALGAQVIGGAEVTEVTHTSGQATGVVCRDGRRFDAPRIVLAGGPWTTDLLRDSVGFALPIIPRRSQILVTERSPVPVGPFVSGNGIYVRQSPFGNLLIGGGGRWERVGTDTSGSIPSIHRIVSRFLGIFPSLASLQLLRAWAGAVAITPDHRPFLGPVPGLDGVLVAAGLCGNGFGLGAGIGQVISDLITTDSTAIDLTPFAVDRFGPDFDWPAVYAERTAGAVEPI